MAAESWILGQGAVIPGRGLWWGHGWKVLWTESWQTWPDKKVCHIFTMTCFFSYEEIKIIHLQKITKTQKYKYHILSFIYRNYDFFPLLKKTETKGNYLEEERKPMTEGWEIKEDKKGVEIIKVSYKHGWKYYNETRYLVQLVYSRKFSANKIKNKKMIQ